MKKLSFRGDTIIEVLVSIVVVSAVLGGAYASATRSFNSTRQAQERGESLKLAEEQLERLKALVEINPAVLTATDEFFCIYENLTYASFRVMPNLHDFNAVDPTNGTSYESCGNSPQGGVKYYIGIQRTGPGTFIVHSTWNSVIGHADDNLEIVYRLHPSQAAASANVAPVNPCIANPLAPGCVVVNPCVLNPLAPGCVFDPNAPRVELTADETQVERGDDTTLRWVSYNGPFDNCNAENQFGDTHDNWNGPLDEDDVEDQEGHENTDDMNEDPTTGNSTVFRIKCYKDGVLYQDSVVVSVTDPNNNGNPPSGNPGNPGNPGGPVCGVSTYFASHAYGSGHDGGNATGGDGGDGDGGDATTCDGGDGGDGGSSAPGGDGQPSAPGAPGAPSTTSTTNYSCTGGGCPATNPFQ